MREKKEKKEKFLDEQSVNQHGVNRVNEHLQMGVSYYPSKDMLLHDV